MAYEMYMGNILCPVTPSKIQLKIKNQNKTMNLVNGTEVTILKEAGLTEISYDLLLPNVPNYPFAVYKSGFVNAKYFLDEFEKMKVEKKPFIFKLLRTLPGGVALYDTDDMMVSLESYTIKEDARQGFDVVVSITLKQYRPYGTKIVKVLDSEGTASVENVRETSNSPAPSDNPVTTYIVVSGDSLWNIAKMFYGNGAKYTAIYEANKDKIANPSVIHPGQVLTIPGASEVAKQGVVANSTTTTNKSATQHSVAVKFAGATMYYGSFDIQYTKDGKLQSEKGRTSPITIKADNNTDVTITIHPKKGSGGMITADSSSRKITWKQISSATDPDTKALTTEYRAKIYANVVVTIAWIYSYTMPVSIKF